MGPVVKELVQRFGPDRLIYGGGFGAGATGASYRACRERVRSYLADLPAGDQAKVLGGTAARLFRFGGARPGRVEWQRRQETRPTRRRRASDSTGIS